MNDLNAIFNGGFDTGSVPAAADYKAYPPGNYLVLIETAEFKETKSGNGHYVKLVLQVMEGEYKGGKLWDQINVDNPSQQCVEIGLGVLAALGKAIGIAKLDSVLQLKDKVVIAHVKVKDGQNNIRTYSRPGQGQEVSRAVQAMAAAPGALPAIQHEAPTAVAPLQVGQPGSAPLCPPAQQATQAIAEYPLPPPTAVAPAAPVAQPAPVAPAPWQR